MILQTIKSGTQSACHLSLDNTQGDVGTLTK